MSDLTFFGWEQRDRVQVDCMWWCQALSSPEGQQPSPLGSSHHDVWAEGLCLCSAPEEGAGVADCGSCDLSTPPIPFLSSGSCSRAALVEQAGPSVSPAARSPRGLLTPLQNPPIQQCLVNRIQLSSTDTPWSFIHINAHTLTALSLLL